MGKKVKKSKQLKFGEVFIDAPEGFKVTKHAYWEGWEEKEFNQYEFVRFLDHTNRTFGAIDKFQGQKRFIKVTEFY